MKSYVSVIFLAFCFMMGSTPLQVSAVSIKEDSAAIGYKCVATAGTHSTAMGYATTASGSASTAMGDGTTASGHYSTAMGDSTTAIGPSSTAMGASTTASGLSSTAMGCGTLASGDYSTAMGHFTRASGDSSLAGGRLMVLSDTADNTFVWGHSTTVQSITTANAFLIFPVGTEGKVGIGTESPNEVLEVAGSGRAFFGDGGGPNRKGLLIDGIEGSAAARLEAYDYGSVTGLNLVINTYGGGNVGIGKIDPGQKLDIAGGNGRVETGYNWLTNSDSRLKNNISTLEGSLDKISRLRGVRFDRKEAGHVNKGEGKHIGVIAQELEKEYPELVFGDEKTGYKAVAYDKLTAVLIEAVKEMKALNEKQQAEIEELRSMIKELKS